MFYRASSPVSRSRFMTGCLPLDHGPIFRREMYCAEDEFVLVAICTAVFRLTKSVTLAARLS